MRQWRDEGLLILLVSVFGDAQRVQLPRSG